MNTRSARTARTARTTRALAVPLLWFSVVACSATDDLGLKGAGGADPGAGGAGGGAGEFPDRPELLAKLNDYLVGEFDNVQQHNQAVVKLVHRSVCALPRLEESAVLWHYIEHDETRDDGRKDGLFSRVEEIRIDGDKMVAKTYGFDRGDALFVDEKNVDEPRDGCSSPLVLQVLNDQDLVYREGCDLTFEAKDDDTFQIDSTDFTCAIENGYIKTTARVFEDGIDLVDAEWVSGREFGDRFEFRRIDDGT